MTQTIEAAAILLLAIFGLTELLLVTAEALRRALHGETRCPSCGVTRAKPREDAP